MGTLKASPSHCHQNTLSGPSRRRARGRRSLIHGACRVSNHASTLATVACEKRQRSGAPPTRTSRTGSSRPPGPEMTAMRSPIGSPSVVSPTASGDRSRGSRFSFWSRTDLSRRASSGPRSRADDGMVRNSAAPAQSPALACRRNSSTAARGDPGETATGAESADGLAPGRPNCADRGRPRHRASAAARKTDQRATGDTRGGDRTGRRMAGR